MTSGGARGATVPRTRGRTPRRRANGREGARRECGTPADCASESNTSSPDSCSGRRHLHDNTTIVSTSLQWPSVVVWRNGNALVSINEVNLR